MVREWLAPSSVNTVSVTLKKCLICVSGNTGDPMRHQLRQNTLQNATETFLLVPVQCFFLIKILFCLCERQSYIEKDRSLPADSFSKWPQVPGLGQTEARSLLQVSYMDSRTQELVPSILLCCCRNISRELDLTCYATMPTQGISLYFMQIWET